MKFFTSIILTALLSYAACLFLPWWSIAVAAFLVAVFISQKPGRSFLSGFAALFLLWAGLSYIISMSNGHLLANKVSMLILKSQSPVMLVIVTALIGGLVAGLAALSGSYLKRIFFKD
ncbi:MAG: hypothetical protein WAT19_00785 [Ferruginibacter sp.]